MVDATSVAFSDSDGDGIAADGNGSGVPLDAPCAGGNNVNCDDNCMTVPNNLQQDTDSGRCWECL